MVDVLVEMSEGAFSNKNPLTDTESNQTQEDTDADIVPDFFVRARRLFTTGAPDYAPGKLARLGSATGLLIFAYFVVSGIMLLTIGTDTSGVRQPLPILAAVEDFSRAFTFLLTVRFPTDLVNVIHPTSGGLALLGAGDRKVSSRQMGTLRCWKLTHDTGFLGLLAWFFFQCGAFVWVCGLAFGVWRRDIDLDGTPDEATPQYLAYLFTVVFMYTIASVGLFPTMICWSLSMKVAAVLAEDAVQEVIKNVRPEALKTDDSWHKHVYEPCGQLARKTMAHISAGWGRGVAMGSLALWTMSFAKLARFLDKVHNDPAYSGAIGIIRTLLPSVAFALGPLLLALDLATVSSLCDLLINNINDLGLSTDSVDHANNIYRKTHPLLSFLKGLHGDQGMGLLM